MWPCLGTPCPPPLVLLRDLHPQEAVTLCPQAGNEHGEARPRAAAR